MTVGEVARSFEPHTASAAGGGRAFADQLDAIGRKRIDQLHQRVDIAAHDAVARFHALNGWQRQAGNLRQLALVEA